MASYVPYTIDGTQLDFQTSIKGVVIGGFVEGLVGNPATAFDQVLTAVRTVFPTGYSITVDGQTLYPKRVAGKGGGGDWMEVQVYFDTDFGGIATVYVIEEQGFEQAYETQRIPGTREAILIPDWTSPTDAGDKVKGDLANCTFSYPMRLLSVRGIKAGSPPPTGTYSGHIGQANDSLWMNLGKGYWKITHGDQAVSRYSGYYQFELAAITKNIEDWSQIKTLYHPKIGRHVTLAAADETAIKNAVYDYGIIKSVPGAVRVGPQPLTSFPAIFGF